MTNITFNSSKRISISSKRQITIPQSFFEALGFETEAECIYKENEIVIRPLRTESSGEFAEEILKDLIKEGYSGEAMLEEFRTRQTKVRPAVEKLLKEADEVAKDKSGYLTMNDIFGDK